MKIIVSAMALAFATTAAAQTAPTPQPQPQEHQAHGQMQHGPMHHDRMQHGQGQPDHAGSHEGHGATCDCCADGNGNGRMDCCEGMEPGHAHHGQPQAPQPQSPQNQ